MLTFSRPVHKGAALRSIAAMFLGAVPALLILPVAVFPAVQLWREDGAAWLGDAGCWTLGAGVVLAFDAIFFARLAYICFGRRIVELLPDGVTCTITVLGCVWERSFYPEAAVLFFGRKRLPEGGFACTAALRGGREVVLAIGRRKEESSPLWEALCARWPGKTPAEGDWTGNGTDAKAASGFPWWALAMGLVLTGMGGVLAARNVQMIAHGERVTGRVVSVDTIRQVSSRPPYAVTYVYCPVVRFTDNRGDVREARSAYRSATRPHIGDIMPGYLDNGEEPSFLPIDAFALFAQPGLFLIPGLLALTLAMGCREPLSSRESSSRARRKGPGNS